jgi:hypothetical protein
MARWRVIADDGLHGAFVALGAAPTHQELALVASAVRRSKDEGALALLGAASHGERDALRTLYATAESTGSSALVALDLATDYGR